MSSAYSRTGWRTSHNWLSSNQSQSQSHIATDGRSISKSWCRAQICITLWQLWSCCSETPSMTRGRGCLLYMPLVLASAVFYGSESLWTRHYILLSQRLPFSSPPTTRRVTVEVLDPASTRVNLLSSKLFSAYKPSTQTAQKTPFLCWCIHCCGRSLRSGTRRKHRFPASQLVL
jgi:hypothetical protein